MELGWPFSFVSNGNLEDLTFEVKPQLTQKVIDNLKTHKAWPDIAYMTLTNLEWHNDYSQSLDSIRNLLRKPVGPPFSSIGRLAPKGPHLF